MAFRVTGYVTEQGVPAIHHVVAQVNINKINKTGVIEMNCYFTDDYKTERDVEKILPLKRLWFDIRPDTFDEYFEPVNLEYNFKDPYEASYCWLKENIDLYSVAENI